LSCWERKCLSTLPNSTIMQKDASLLYDESNPFLFLLPSIIVIHVGDRFNNFYFLKSSQSDPGGHLNREKKANPPNGNIEIQYWA
jgi:hypothetical protein